MKVSVAKHSNPRDLPRRYRDFDPAGRLSDREQWHPFYEAIPLAVSVRAS
jgi:hypothetical protein